MNKKIAIGIEIGILLITAVAGLTLWLSNKNFPNENANQMQSTVKQSSQVTQPSYTDSQYLFSINYNSDWSVSKSYEATYFLKKPLKVEDIANGNISDSNCMLSFIALSNPNQKDLDDFWSTANNKKSIKLGNNNFVEIKRVGEGGTSTNNKGIISYTTIINSKKQIFSFDTIENANCQKEVEGILSTLVVN